jgi:hypothetical protein
MQLSIKTSPLFETLLGHKNYPCGEVFQESQFERLAAMCLVSNTLSLVCLFTSLY